MGDPDEVITVLRLLRYKGPRRWVESTFRLNKIKKDAPFKLIDDSMSIEELIVKEVEGEEADG